MINLINFFNQARRLIISKFVPLHLGCFQKSNFEQLLI